MGFSDHADILCLLAALLCSGGPVRLLPFLYATKKLKPTQEAEKHVGQDVHSEVSFLCVQWLWTTRRPAGAE